MGQVDDEAVGLLFHSADDHQGLAEVSLGVARRMGQGDEHLLGLAAMLPHVVLDDGVLAVGHPRPAPDIKVGDIEMPLRPMGREQMWMPDGSRIAFQSFRDGDANPEVYVISP